jgi:tetratricopeptide (TPR) repeat protein
MLKSILYLFFVLSMSFSQQTYRSADQVGLEWEGYTKFQRDEMVSFCDFLFNEGYYERCLISSFQFLYRLPDDPVKPALLHLIARSYEEMGNYSLARRYYNRVVDIEAPNSIAYKSAKYREVYCYLMEGDIALVKLKTDLSKDPYFLTLRGYGYLKSLDWEKARTVFISAEEKFKDKHYSKLMMPLYQVIENVSGIRKHSKFKVVLSGLFLPGGGQLALKDKKNAQGILISALSFYSVYNLGRSSTSAGDVRFSRPLSTVMPIHEGVDESFNLAGGVLSKQISAKSELVKYTLPPIIFGSALYVSSFVKSFFDTKEKNKNLIQYYANDKIALIPPQLFMDFEEPSVLNNN